MVRGTVGMVRTVERVKAGSRGTLTISYWSEDA
jgi:hypothetical protein